MSVSVALIRLPEVMRRTGFGRSSLYAYIKRGQFPAPVRLGERSVAWKSSDVDAWIESRPSVHPIAAHTFADLPSTNGHTESSAAQSAAHVEQGQCAL